MTFEELKIYCKNSAVFCETRNNNEHRDVYKDSKSRIAYSIGIDKFQGTEEYIYYFNNKEKYPCYAINTHRFLECIIGTEVFLGITYPDEIKEF